jgi:hypothetical protein
MHASAVPSPHRVSLSLISICLSLSLSYLLTIQNLLMPLRCWALFLAVLACMPLSPLDMLCWSILIYSFMSPYATRYVSSRYFVCPHPTLLHVSTTYDVHVSSYCCAVLLSSIRILLRACIIRCAVIAFENGHIQQRAGEEVAGVRRLRAQARQANDPRACCIIRILLRACLLRCAFISLANRHAQQRAGQKMAAVRRL